MVAMVGIIMAWLSVFAGVAGWDRGCIPMLSVTATAFSTCGRLRIVMTGWLSVSRFRLTPGELRFLRMDGFKWASSWATAGGQRIWRAPVNDVSGIPGYGFAGGLECPDGGAVPGDGGAAGEAAVAHGGVFGRHRRQAAVPDGRIAAGAVVVVRLVHGVVSSYRVSDSKPDASALDPGLWMPVVGALIGLNAGGYGIYRDRPGVDSVPMNGIGGAG